MPPALALSGCVVVVVLLLWLERRNRPPTSWAMLVPTTWLLVVASRPIGTWFAFSRADSFEDGSPLDRLVLTALIVVSLILLSRNKSHRGRQLSRYLPLIGLYAFLASSILWADVPFVSLKRWIRLAGAVPVGLLLVVEPNPLASLITILRRIAYIHIPLSLVLIKYYPTVGVSYSRWSGVQMWNGVTLTKNALGQLCLITVLTILCAALTRPRAIAAREFPAPGAADTFVVSLALYLMFGAPSGAYSATSVAVLICVATAVIFMALRPTAAPRLITLCCGAMVVGWMGMALTEQFASHASTLLGRDDTFTGRTEIWAKILTDARAHSLLGSGFGGYFNTDNEFTAAYGNEGHNGILDVYVETGLVGVTILLAFLWSVVRGVRRAVSQAFPLGVLAAAIVLTNLGTNFTESLFLKSSSYIWTLLIFTSLMSNSTYWVEPTGGVAANSLPVHLHRSRSGVAKERPVNGRRRPFLWAVRHRPAASTRDKGGEARAL